MGAGSGSAGSLVPSCSAEGGLGCCAGASVAGTSRVASCTAVDAAGSGSGAAGSAFWTAGASPREFGDAIRGCSSLGLEDLPGDPAADLADAPGSVNWRG